MKSAILSFCLAFFTLSCYAQKFNERYMYLYHGEDSSNPKLISKERYNNKGKVVFAEYFDYFNDIITDEGFYKGKYYYTYKDTSLIKELYAGYAYQFDVWGNATKLDTSNFADSSIVEYTYSYDSANRMISKTITDYEKRTSGRCGLGADIKKDSTLFKTDEWYRNTLIDEMNIENERQKNKSWTQRRSTTYVYKYYDDDAQEPISIETVDNGKVYAYRRFKYNQDRNNVLVSKTWEDYSNYSGTNQMALSSIAHTRYKDNYYIINRVYIYDMNKVAYTDSTATLHSIATTYYLDNKKRVIQIHNKNDLKGDIYISRRKDGYITKIVTIDNEIPLSDEKHKTTVLFRYK